VNEDFGPQIRPEVIAAERAVLGAAIQSTAAAQEAIGLLRADQFSYAAHFHVFTAITRLAGNGEPVDPASVLAELARAGTLTKVGAPDAGTGAAYLHTLIASSYGNLAYHARMVRARWVQDNLTSALKSAEQIAASSSFDMNTDLDRVHKLVAEATTIPDTGQLRSQAELVTEAIDDLETRTDPGLPTGICDLDALIGGLRPGQLIVIGAATGVGKSLVALTIADHISGKLGLPGLFASLEMTARELTQRRIAAAARVLMTRLINHELSGADWDHITAAMSTLTGSRMLVDDEPDTSLARIRSQLRAIARTGDPARYAVIDYLGLLSAPSAENRQVSVAALSRGAKLLAREFAIPVILLAQLNRAPAGRTDKRPVLSDLRESGAIEADSDVVLLLYRPDYYDPESPRAGEIDVIVAKQRQGPTATVTCAFQGHYGRITDLAPEWTPSAAAERKPA
jgi:replicative DNA helicase